MKTKKSIHGKQITREQAYEGLGDPSTWESDAKKLEEEFKKKPEIKKLKDSQIAWLNALTTQPDPYGTMASDAILWNNKDTLESLNKIFKNQIIWVKNPRTGEMENWINGKLA